MKRKPFEEDEEGLYMGNGVFSNSARREERGGENFQSPPGGREEGQTYLLPEALPPLIIVMEQYFFKFGFS